MAMTEEERQHVIDTEHLRLLSLFHYISGALTILFSSMFILHLGFMAVMFSMAPAQKDGTMLPFAFMGVFFGLIILAGIALGIAEILSGRSIARRQKRMLSMIIAGPGVLMMPFGTILSVMTWVVLSRASVRALYGEPAAT